MPSGCVFGRLARLVDNLTTPQSFVSLVALALSFISVWFAILQLSKTTFVVFHSPLVTFLEQGGDSICYTIVVTMV